MMPFPIQSNPPYNQPTRRSFRSGHFFTKGGQSPGGIRESGGHKMEHGGEITRLLGEISSGKTAAMERLLPLVYDELHRLASRYFQRERGDHTLQPTALVHEAYLKLVDQRAVKWESRAHFLSIAATLMRRVLLDYARSHGSNKRGGHQQKILLDDGMAVTEQKALEVIALDGALTRLADIDPAQSR